MEKVKTPKLKDLSNIKINNSKRFACNICRDSGYIIRDGKAVICSCRRDERLKKRQRAAGLSPKLASVRLDMINLDCYNDSKMTSNGNSYRENAAIAVAAVRSFCREVLRGTASEGIMLTGPVGSGKTYMAAACCNELLFNGIKVKFCVVPDFLDELRSTFNGNSDKSEYELMQEAKDADVLVLDDLGAHNYSDYTIKSLFALINYRINYEKPMLVTTNLERREIEELLGSRIYSRLAEGCRFFRLDNTEDIRIVNRINSKKSVD